MAANLKSNAVRQFRRDNDPAYREHCNQVARKTYTKHRRSILDRIAELNALNKLAVINVLTNGEGTCRWCGQGDIDVLTVDHINDDGAKHRLLIGAGKFNCGGGDQTYKWIIKNDYPEGFQVLCHNCNWKKEVMRRRRQRELARQEAV